MKRKKPRTAKLPNDALAVFRAWGSKGGKKAAQSLTPEQRTERARKAGKAMQAKRREGKA